MKATGLILGILVIPFFVFGCVSATYHAQDLPPATTDSGMTLGKVQMEIHNGMTQGEVLEGLGSPNIVTRDADGKETWAYDMMSREIYYSNSSVDVGAHALIIGGVYSKDAGATKTVQKTLTVIIKFGKDMKVSEYSYHSSRF
jgi:hypothetical protein